MRYRLCVCASGSLITNIWYSFASIKLSCLHLGQNRGKFIRTVSSRILVLVLLPQKGHKIQSTSPIKNHSPLSVFEDCCLCPLFFLYSLIALFLSGIPTPIKSPTIIIVKSIFSPHASLFFNILIDTNIETIYITITKMIVNNISRTGELKIVKSSLLSPTGLFVMSSKVIKNPATGIYINTLPLIEPYL